MRKLLVLMGLITLLGAGGASEKIFDINFNLYKNGTVEMEDFEIINGSEGDYYGEEGDFIFRLRSANDETLWEESRTVSWYVFTNPPTPIEMKRQHLRIEYIQNATDFIVEKNNQTLLEYDITGNICTYDGVCSSYCSGKGVDPDCTCGDNVCQSHEDAEICFEDCGESGGGETGSGTGVSQPGESSSQSGGLFLKAVYVLIALLVLALVWILWKSDF